MPALYSPTASEPRSRRRTFPLSEYTFCVTMHEASPGRSLTSLIDKPQSMLRPFGRIMFRSPSMAADTMGVEEGVKCEPMEPQIAAAGGSCAIPGAAAGAAAPLVIPFLDCCPSELI